MMFARFISCFNSLTLVRAGTVTRPYESGSTPGPLPQSISLTSHLLPLTSKKNLSTNRGTA